MYSKTIKRPTDFLQQEILKRKKYDKNDEKLSDYARKQKILGNHDLIKLT